MSALRPLRILMLTDALHDDSPGGSRRVVKELAQGLARRGDQVTVVAPRWHGDEAAFSSDEHGIFIRRYGQGRQGLHGAPRLIGAGRRLLTALHHTSPRFDLLHVHFAYSHLPVLLPAPLQVAHRTIRTFYGPWPLEAAVEEGPRHPHAIGAALGSWTRFTGRAYVERRSLAHSQHVIALSAYSQRQLVTMFGVQPARIVLIPGGVDHQRFVPPSAAKADLRRRLGLPDAGPMILTVRRLAARMGLPALIAALPGVLEALAEKPHLVVVGQGHLRAQLEDQVRRLGLSPWVHFTGFVSDADLPLYYQAADLFVLPTRSLEGFGLSTLEALSVGVPVLGTPAGATPELLAQVDARLILRDTRSEAMVEGIVRYFTQVKQHLQPSLLRDVVTARYTWEAVVDQTRALYHQAL